MVGQAWFSCRVTRGKSWIASGLLWSGLCVLIAEVGRLDGSLVSGWQAAYVIVAAQVLGAGINLIRIMVSPSADSRRNWKENVRLGSLLVLAVWLFRPFLTTEFFGGLDAQSYGYAMVDALQQARAGVFPVFVGQGEFMFNGAIHPIRTAPYYQNLGIVIDVLTARSLTPLGVGHLVMVVTAIQAGLTCYVCLALLAPQARGVAWTLAGFYLMAPAMAHYAFPAEMYMTFMAFAYLPLVLYGNIRIMQQGDSWSWNCLAVGLALVWVCHPPVAVWVTLMTLSLHGLRLLAGAPVGEFLRRSAVASLLFLGLSAYYFWAMAEISTMLPRQLKGIPLELLASGAGFLSLVRYVMTSGKLWLALAVLVSIALGLIKEKFGYWLGFCALFGALLEFTSRWYPHFHWRGRLPEISVALALCAGLLTDIIAPPAESIPALRWTSNVFPKIFQPVSPTAALLTDMQVGYALWGSLLLGITAAVYTRAVEIRLLALLALVGVALLVPLFGVSRWLLGLVPAVFFQISSEIAWIRYLPALIGLATFLGFLGAVHWISTSSRSRGLLSVLAVAALGWSLYESEKFVRRGYHSKTTSMATAAFLRSENIRQFAYIFSGMPVSPYLTNGVVDYHLESRLLHVADPAQELEAIMLPSEVETLTLRARPDETSPQWLRLDPEFTLAPGERVRLRFEFLERDYSGTLIMQGPNEFFREYQLPAAGFFPKSFGVSPERPKTLAVWNVTEAPQPVRLTFVSAVPVETSGAIASSEFARVEVSSYRVDRLPVQTVSLIPYYHAVVDTPVPAYLETPRSFIPGYRAEVNGQVTEVKMSPNNMAMVLLPPGQNSVELRYVGTWALRAALAVSFLVWFGVLGVVLRAGWHRLKSHSGVSL